MMTGIIMDWEWNHVQKIGNNEMGWRRSERMWGSYMDKSLALNNQGLKQTVLFLFNFAIKQNVTVLVLGRALVLESQY